MFYPNNGSISAFYLALYFYLENVFPSFENLYVLVMELVPPRD